MNLDQMLLALNLSDGWQKGDIHLSGISTTCVRSICPRTESLFSESPIIEALEKS